MKKNVKNILILVLVFLYLLPIQFCHHANVAALNVDVLTEQNEALPRVTGLIVATNLSLKASGNYLNLLAEVYCSGDVVKCGFKEIIIQRRFNSSDPWVDYIVYEDMYYDDTAHAVTKSIPYSSAYDYRATCVFYAKKNLILTQKIDGVSNII